MTIAFLLLALFWLFVFAGYSLVSKAEGEGRAALISAIIAFGGGGAFVLGVFLPALLQMVILLGVVCVGGLVFILFLVPVGQVGRLRDVPTKRFDERDIMFTRARLKPESKLYNTYYALRPDNEAKDNLFRARPGLLSLDARFADEKLFAVTGASFVFTETMHGMVEGEPASRKIALPETPARTEFVKSLARYFGALDVGITHLKPEHVYSHIGRGPGEWGAPLSVEHTFAIAFTVEMDYGMMGTAPEAPVVMESARQYVEAGRVAVQLAETIRAWGYPARAHMDGNYRVICPLVARDAGLGEIGRMGLLMTPRKGPRVRIAVVTTDLELNPDPDKQDAGMIDFCTMCARCAENCPPKAISLDDRIVINGALRWQIDSDLCFRYWTAIGTDCGRCMSVCPYSHPDSFFHNAIRWGNIYSGLFRRTALRLDDLFYGKAPIRREPPEWIKVED